VSIDFTKTYDFCEKISFYNIPIQVGMPMKQVTLIKMYLDEKFVSFGRMNICLTHFLFSLV